MKLQGKVAIITGGSKGIGLGCGRAFARYGCNVVLAARGEQAGKEAEKEIAELGGTAWFLPTDVTQEADLQSLVAATVDRFGRLDCIVNNAGWHPLGRMATIDEIGEVCAFLASEEASFITGQVICPDGGAALGYRR
jgi:NAD(P)-dependent dehydrogenase (short-subunit alcohol dehydrogenase family)